MLASWKYISTVDEETLLQSARAYCVCIPVLIVSADLCLVASIVSVSMTGAVCILHRLVRFLYNHWPRGEWHPRPACFSIMASTAVSSLVTNAQYLTRPPKNISASEGVRGGNRYKNNNRRTEFNPKALCNGKKRIRVSFMYQNIKDNVSQI